MPSTLCSSRRINGRAGRRSRHTTGIVRHAGGIVAEHCPLRDRRRRQQSSPAAPPLPDTATSLAYHILVLRRLNRQQQQQQQQPTFEPGVHYKYLARIRSIYSFYDIFRQHSVLGVKVHVARHSDRSILVALRNGFL